MTDIEIIQDRIAVPGPNGSNIAAGDYTDILNRLAELERRTLPPQQAILSGRYYGALSTLSGWAPLTSEAMFANRIYGSAFYCPQDAAFNQVGLEVTLAAANAAMRFGVYTVEPDGTPDTLVATFDPVDVTAIGYRSRPITLTLPRGLYWICGASTQSISANQTVAGPGMTATLGHSGTSGTTPRAGLWRSTDLAPGFTTLPATFGAVTTSALTPAFWLRAS